MAVYNLEHDFNLNTEVPSPVYNVEHDFNLSTEVAPEITLTGPDSAYKNEIKTYVASTSPVKVGLTLKLVDRETPTKILSQGTTGGDGKVSLNCTFIAAAVYYLEARTMDDSIRSNTLQVTVSEEVETGWGGKPSIIIDEAPSNVLEGKSFTIKGRVDNTSFVYIGRYKLEVTYPDGKKEQLFDSNIEPYVDKPFEVTYTMPNKSVKFVFEAWRWNKSLNQWGTGKDDYDSKTVEVSLRPPDAVGNWVEIKYLFNSPRPIYAKLYRCTVPLIGCGVFRNFGIWISMGWQLVSTVEAKSGENRVLFNDLKLTDDYSIETVDKDGVVICRDVLVWSDNEFNKTYELEYSPNWLLKYWWLIPVGVLAGLYVTRPKPVQIVFPKEEKKAGG